MEKHVKFTELTEAQKAIVRFYGGLPPLPKKEKEVLNQSNGRN